MHNVQVTFHADNKQTCQPKLAQKNGQSKQGTKVTNKQAFEINKHSSSSLTWKSWKKDASWIGKFVPFPTLAKTWKGEILI